MSSSSGFQWPDGKRLAVSISFDDARDCHLDAAVPILDEYGVKGTFYVCPHLVAPRTSEWKAAMESGHEMGNHTKTHPCSCNFKWNRKKALEDFTYEEISDDILSAGREIEALLGARPDTFAYPCGQKFVGRGAGVRSYVPIVAENFICGRGFREEYWNNPLICDMAQAAGTEFDCMDMDSLTSLLAAAGESGGWIALVGHDIGDPGSQTITTQVLEAMCRIGADETSGVWCATISDVAKHVIASRRKV